MKIYLVRRFNTNFLPFGGRLTNYKTVFHKTKFR